MPNANRTYYLSRSQPPYFAAMVGLYATATDTARAFPRISWGAIMAGAVLAKIHDTKTLDDDTAALTQHPMLEAPVEHAVVPAAQGDAVLQVGAPAELPRVRVMDLRPGEGDVAPSCRARVVDRRERHALRR